MDSPREKHAGYPKMIGLGCAVVLAIGVLTGVMIAANWDSIASSDEYRSLSATAKKAKTKFGQAIQLEKELAPFYEAQSIRVRMSSRFGNDDSVESLVVELINPGFDLPEPREQRRPLAREIAGRIAALHPEMNQYDQVVIAFVRQSGGGLISKNAEYFRFPTASLVSRATPPPT